MVNRHKTNCLNHFIGKSKTVCTDEKNRYNRFFGNFVNYTNNSFEDFMSNPEPFL